MSIATNKSKIFELSVFAILIMVINASLFTGKVCDSLIFYPKLFIGGDWWRIITFPFVHVSLYHLLLDAGAFLLLYHGLQEPSRKRRIFITVACAAGSLSLSILASPLSGGLCGLSGTAHGLMAVSALEMIPSSDRTVRRPAIISFLIVFLKSIYEAYSGNIAFEFLHFGYIGNAISTCHLGGVLGGLTIYSTFKITAEIKFRKTRCENLA